MAFNCRKCDKSVPADSADCRTCSQCDSYYHAACLDGNNATPNLEWICGECTAEMCNNGPLMHIVLDLRKLEEEIVLEKRSLRKKYAVLQTQLDTIKGKTKTLLDSCSPASTLGEVQKLYATLRDEFTSLHAAQQSPTKVATDDHLQHMFARQVIPSDLPKFSGRPEDWPIFISSYNNSTEACGFSNVENLIRLQRCLEGPALQSVRSKLLLPNCVPQVISTLKLLYGRPDLLISTLLSQIRRLQAPDSEDLNSLIHFGLAVQNLADHIVAAGLHDHLNNPCLLQELVSKLPTHLKLKWATHKQLLGVVNIASYSAFMYEIVVAASQVTTPTSVREIPREREGAQCYEYDDERDRTPEMDSQLSRREKNNRCSICSGYGHRSQYCAVFKTMQVSERWDEVNKAQLCPSCLNRHLPWPCKTAAVCGIGGCMLKHHQLLHTPLQNPPSTSGACLPSSGSESSTCLKYVPVRLYGKSKTVDTYAFIDEGSTATMMESSLAEELQISGAAEDFSIQWVDGTKAQDTKSQCIGLQISGINESKRHSLFRVHTQTKLCIPKQSISTKRLKQTFTHLRGIDVNGYQHAKPRLLIGLTNTHLTVPTEVRAGKVGEPIAFNCALGWCVYGNKALAQ